MLIRFHLHIERRYTWPAFRCLVKGVKRREPRLTFTRRKRRFESLVHILKDRRARTKVCGDVQQGLRVLRKQGIPRTHVGRHIRSAKSIDGLLGVANEK